MLLKPRTIEEMRKQIKELDPPPKVLVIAGIHEPAEPTHRLITSKTGKKRFHEWYEPEDVVFVKYPANQTPVKALLDAYKRLSELGSGNRIGNAEFKHANEKHVSELREEIGGVLKKFEEGRLESLIAAIKVRKAIGNSPLSIGDGLRPDYGFLYSITGLDWDLLWDSENRKNLGEHPSTTPIELHYASYGVKPFVVTARKRDVNLLRKLVEVLSLGSKQDELNSLELPPQKTEKKMWSYQLQKKLPEPARRRANFMYRLFEPEEYKYLNSYLRVWPESMHETKRKNLKFLHVFLNKLVKNKAAEQAQKQP